MRRIFIFLTLLMTGCTTALWAPDYQWVEIEGFYINPETSDLIVTSDDAAYIFPIEHDFADILMLSREVAFIPSFRDFSMDSEGKVAGTIRLMLVQSDPTPELLNRLHERGFNEQSATSRLTLSTELHGSKYLIEGEIPLEKMKERHIVRIAQPRTGTNITRTVIATPVTLAYDAVVVVPVALIVFTVIGLGL